MRPIKWLEHGVIECLELDPSNERLVFRVRATGATFAWERKNPFTCPPPALVGHWVTALGKPSKALSSNLSAFHSFARNVYDAVVQQQQKENRPSSAKMAPPSHPEKTSEWPTSQPKGENPPKILQSQVAKPSENVLAPSPTGTRPPVAETKSLIPSSDLPAMAKEEEEEEEEPNAQATDEISSENTLSPFDQDFETLQEANAQSREALPPPEESPLRVLATPDLDGSIELASHVLLKPAGKTDGSTKAPATPAGLKSLRMVTESKPADTKKKKTKRSWWWLLDPDGTPAMAEPSKVSHHTRTGRKTSRVSSYQDIESSDVEEEAAGREKATHTRRVAPAESSRPRSNPRRASSSCVNYAEAEGSDVEEDYIESESDIDDEVEAPWSSEEKESESEEESVSEDDDDDFSVDISKCDHEHQDNVQASSPSEKATSKAPSNHGPRILALIDLDGIPTESLTGVTGLSRLSSLRVTTNDGRTNDGRTNDGRGGSKAVFPIKLYQMVQWGTAQCPEACRWAMDGKHFLIDKTHADSLMLLSKFFGHSKWRLFWQQFRRYGVQYCGDMDHARVYHHPKFHKNLDPETLITNIPILPRQLPIAAFRIGRGGSKAVFPIKLYQMVQWGTAQCLEACRWTMDGKHFLIDKTHTDFLMLLSKFFGHSKWWVFWKQLRRYGVQYCGDMDHARVYHHPKFHKNLDPETLITIMPCLASQKNSNPPKETRKTQDSAITYGPGDSHPAKRFKGTAGHTGAKPRGDDGDGAQQAATHVSKLTAENQRLRKRLKQQREETRHLRREVATQKSQTDFYRQEAKDKKKQLKRLLKQHALLEKEMRKLEILI